MNMRIQTDSGPIEVPNTDQVTHEVVWHYTDAHGLLGIIERNQLWASSTLSLNDSSEIEHGIGVLERVWRTHRASYSAERVRAIENLLAFDIRNALGLDLYIVSASSERDLLNQWQGYAGAQGYALGLDTSVALDYLLDVGDPETTNAASFPSGWYRVIYRESEQAEAARQMFEFLMHDAPFVSAISFSMTSGMFLATLAARFKHEAFAGEREVRFVYSKLAEFKEHFRTGRRGLVPYVAITTRPPGMLRAATASHPLPIRGVVCGPAARSDNAPTEQAVRRLLKVHGYEVDVKTSDLPYRP